jgi:curved DNA-binding protein CbpA
MNLSMLPYTPERDVYRLLDIRPDAETGEVVAACRRLARTFHPDMNRSPRANEEMQVVNAVRHLLTDPVRRAAYDGARRRYLADRRRPRLPAAHQLRRPPPRALRVARSTLEAVRASWEALATVARSPHCPRCSADVAREYRFCADCGTRLLLAAPETN